LHLDRLTGLSGPVLVPVTAIGNDAATGDATELLLGSAG
jgi:hypothetical protein